MMTSFTEKASLAQSCGKQHAFMTARAVTNFNDFEGAGI